jgi:hypothetical protein
MRIIARDEMGKFVSETAPATAAADDDRVGKLEKQIAALTVRVDELEKPATTSAAAAKRNTRKAPETTE